MNDWFNQNTIVFSVPFESLHLKIEHVENTMGRYKNGMPPPFPILISKAINDAVSLTGIMGGYRCFKIDDFAENQTKLKLEDITLNIGRTIGKQIKGAESIAVFACTIGSKISDLSKIYFESGDIAKGYILDMLGSAIVEKAMDIIQKKLAEAVSRKGRKITNRFSPGYCEWHVREQQQLFSLLPKNFCGITLLETSLMLPIKSVSGIIGIGKSVTFLDYPCKICDRHKCVRRRNGD
jgi:hypothetical protein